MSRTPVNRFLRTPTPAELIASSAPIPAPIQVILDVGSILEGLPASGLTTGQIFYLEAANDIEQDVIDIAIGLHSRDTRLVPMAEQERYEPLDPERRGGVSALLRIWQLCIFSEFGGHYRGLYGSFLIPGVNPVTAKIRRLCGDYFRNGFKGNQNEPVTVRHADIIYFARKLVAPGAIVRRAIEYLRRFPLAGESPIDRAVSHVRAILGISRLFSNWGDVGAIETARHLYYDATGVLEVEKTVEPALDIFRQRFIRAPRRQGHLCRIGIGRPKSLVEEFRALLVIAALGRCILEPQPVQSPMVAHPHEDLLSPNQPSPEQPEPQSSDPRRDVVSLTFSQCSTIR